jgi:PAS domain S-box-containing protein
MMKSIVPDLVPSPEPGWWVFHAGRPRASPDAPLERLARLAATLLRAPTVAVSLPGAGQATEGADGALREVCLRAAATGHPATTEGDAESACLAVPLAGAEGGVIGSLGVAAPPGRRWTEDETASLRDLAALAAAGLDAHAREGRDPPGLSRAIVEASPLGIAVLDRHGMIRMWSPAAERIFGWAEGEVLGGPSPIVPPEAAEAFQQMRARTLTGERFTGVETVRRRKDGATVEVSVSTAPLASADGQVHSSLVLFEDITARRRAAASVEEVQQRLRDALDTLPVGIFLVAAGGRVEWQNRAGRRIWGGQPLSSNLDEYRGWWAGTRRRVQSAEWALPRALSGEVVTGQLVEIEGFDGARRTILNSAFPLLDPAGAVAAAIVVNEDVTERVRAEEEVQRQNAFVRLLQEVAVAANEAATLEEALRRTLRSVCAHSGWPVGHALLPQGSGELASTGLWHVPGEGRFAAFRDAVAGARFGPGVGLPGRALAQGEPVWTHDVTGDPHLPPAAGGQDPGVRAGVAFPVRVGEETVAVLEFYSERGAAPDAPLLEVLSNVGTQLGRVVERQRALQSLHESEERFRLLFQKSPLPRWVLDERTLAFLDVNEAAVQQYGYSRGEFLAMSLGALWPAGEAPAEAWHGAQRHRRKDGALIDVEVSVQEVVWAGRKVRVAVALDVTERRRAEARLRFLELAGKVLGGVFELEHRVESLARLAVPALADFCWIDVLGADGEVVRTGGAHADPDQEPLLRELRGPLAAPDAGTASAAVLRAGDPLLVPDATDDHLRELAAGEEALAVLRRLAPRSLMVLPLAARGRTLGSVTLASADPGRRYGDDDVSLAGEVARRAALLFDNSRLYRQAQQAIRAREDILAVVSHELRNPLNAIVALVETLLHWLPDDAWRARERRQLESLLQTSGQMTRLVQDLMDVTRMEGGHFSVRQHLEEADAIVHDTAELLRPLAERGGVHLQARAAPGLPPVRADRQRVVQVISNLVGNAIRLTPPDGSVVVGAEPAGDEVRFWVSDTGPGISGEHLPHVFDRFWRPARAGGLGAGLGLAISRGIVEAHGGRIWVESTGPEGTTFSFTVPAAPAPEAGAPAGLLDEVSPFRAVVELPDTRSWSEPAPPPADPARERAEAADRLARFTAEVGPAPGGDGPDLVGYLREQIVTAVHMGHLHEGDRLPSIREISRAFGGTTHGAVQAYDVLARERLVEKRGRSGMYVARQDSPESGLLGETAAWVAGVLSGAFDHQIKIPQVPELIRRWTTGVRLRCACIESDAETRATLCTELQTQFGLEPHPIRTGDLPEHRPGRRVYDDPACDALQKCDLVVTTVYDAAAVRPWAEALDKPLIVATYNPEHAAAIERHLQGGPLTVVCTDPGFGERVRALRGGRYRDRIHVVLADDAEALAELDPARPVLLTRAAHQRLEGVDLRLLVPLSPFLSPSCARTLLEVIVRLNIQARRV